MWSETSAKVVEFSPGDKERPGSRSASPGKPGRLKSGHNGSLSRAGSMNSINLDTWDMMDGEMMDDKDRRIRELEDTLRKVLDQTTFYLIHLNK